MSLKYIDGNGNEHDIAGVGKDGSTVNAIGRLSSGTAIGDIVIDGAVTTFYAPTSPVTRYTSPWANSFEFYCPIGRHTLIICSNDAMYVLWNPADNFHIVTVYGSGYSISRDTSDLTKFRFWRTNGGPSTMTAVVF